MFIPHLQSKIERSIKFSYDVTNLVTI